MKRNKLKMPKAGISSTAAIVIGVVIAALASVILIALMSNLILNGHLGEQIATVIIFAIRSVSLLIGALIGGLLMKHNYLKLVGLIAAGYLLVLTGIGIVFYSGSLKNFLLGMISVLVGGVAALLILQKPKGNRLKLKKFTL